MSKNFDLIGVGSPIVDSLVNVSDEFIKNSVDGDKGGMELVDATTIEKLLSLMESEVTRAPGGSAANTIFGAAKLGLSTTFLGKLGNDSMSKYYESKYSDIGGDISRFKQDDSPNGHCLSMITPDSERTMRTNLGAAMNLSPDEISVDDFINCNHAHIEGYVLFNKDLMYKVLESAKEAGCTISLDLASFEVVNATKDILDDILKNYVDIVFANEDEAKAFTGMDNDYQKMAEELAKLCKVAAVKLGKDGAIICSEGEPVRVDADMVDKVIDTTGAGDLWAAGFLYGYLNGNGLENSARIGSICGAEIVQVIGASMDNTRWPDIKSKIEKI